MIKSFVLIYAAVMMVLVFAWVGAGANDESECILAYHGAKPSFLSNITGVINHGEVLELLLTSDWVSPDEDEI